MGGPTDYGDIRLSAQELASKHGRNAASQAAKLANQAREKGDGVGYQYWKLVEARSNPAFSFPAPRTNFLVPSEVEGCAMFLRA